MTSLLTTLALSSLPLLAAAPGDGKIHYPETRTVDVVDNYHGTRVPDPYRWLEQDVRVSPEVADWVRRENALTMPYLAAIPERAAIRKRLRQLWNYERYSSPRRVAGRYYFSKNNGLQNQSVLYVAEPGGKPRLVLDPNQWAKDGTVALTGLSFSPQGRYLAYARSAAGSDWSRWFVRDLQSGRDLADEIHWTKFSGVAWTADERGFFYSRFPAPAKGKTFQALNKNMRVYYHRVGTAQAEDVLVYARPDHPEWGFRLDTTEDGRYLVISIWKGTDPNARIVYKDLLQPYGMPLDLIDNFDHEYSFIGNDGPVFFFTTNLEAANRRVIAIDIGHPQQKNWREVIPEAKEALQGVTLTGNQLIAAYLRDAVSRVRMYHLDGTHIRDLKMPGLGTVSGLAGRRSDTEAFYVYTGITTPPSIYRYDLITGKSELWRRARFPLDPSHYETHQVFYHSKDGTRIPMFIAYKKGLKLDGNRPTLLYGYGGFDISLTPRFSATRMAWMEMGGVFAMANLRGGGEYGEKWHRAGTRLHKQNVFDDFIAAAEYLIQQGYTRTSRLAIQGASNGGLLVGAVLTQRPDLFGAALPAVGVMDMLRFQRFTAGRYWVDDYGSSDNPEEFKALYAYSPYHNIRDGVKYPPTLITTADHDDRVVPGHSFKFAARLQKAQASDAPILIRIETRAGHGGGKPTEKRIEEAADQWAFLVKNLKMTLPEGYGQ